MRFIIFLSLVVFPLCLLASSVRAADPVPLMDPVQQRAQELAKTRPVERPPEIDQAENYFRQLKTVKARFVQTAADGKQSRGNFYLSRPGKLRFEYDPPLKDFVVADGLFIYFYDGELKQQTNAPISQTLADFLLRKDLSLSKDLKVSRIMRADGILQLTVVQRAEPGAGSITLGFREKPVFELKKWRVKDAQGMITEIELFDTKFGVTLPGGLFAYHDPQERGLNR